MPREASPSFKVLKRHQDPTWGFEFWYPGEWHRFGLTAGHEGVLYAPDPLNNATAFMVEARDVGMEMKPEDLDDLRAGFLEGLRSLPACQIEEDRTLTAGPVIGVEAKYTYREGEATRKCWARLLHAGTRQFHAVAQGETPDEYTYWLPMLFEMMMTVEIKPASA